ncbi:MAG: rod shape-determining protein MreD [Clostridiales bacterium]|nr:rod shape-determining protein MreD [Clostridiales bacterium]
MKRIIVAAISILMCFLLQTSVFDLFKLANTAPNVLLILVSSVAVMRGQKAGMLTGFFSGLLLDIFYGAWLGGFAFVYMFFGFVDGYFNRIYYSDDNFLPLIMIAVDDLVYGLVMYIVYGLLQNHLHFLFYLKSYILPEIVYTVAVGLVLYQIMLRVNDRLDRNRKESEDYV